MIQLLQGDCLDLMHQIPDGSIDAVITDPPYPEISRDYGRMTEAEWFDMMHALVPEIRRVLKPSGSAVFILQPNSRKVGSMRGWLWEFMAWVCRDWNMVQDAWWWNTAAMPTVHTHRTVGLMRPSLKAAVWCGSPDCYRNQDAVLWRESQRSMAERHTQRATRNNLTQRPSGQTVRYERITNTALERGGVTPFNVLPMSNVGTSDSAGMHGHGAGTPFPLAAWWMRYICPPEGVVLDPFMGSGTMGLAAIQHGAGFVGMEQMPKHFATAKARIEAEQVKPKQLGLAI